MKLLVVALIVPAAIVLGIAAYDTQIFSPASSNPPAKGIVWHGRTFAARDDFARWLRSRGVRYAVWARRHQAFLRDRARRRAEYAAGAERAGRNNSGWIVRSVGGGLVILTGFGLSVVLLRRRWPGRRGSLRQTLRLAASRAAPATKGGARLMLHWASATALLFSRTAKSSAKIIRNRGIEVAGFLAHRASPAAKGGVRLMLRWAKVMALLSSRAAKSSAKIIRSRGTEFAGFLARRAAPAANRDTRLTLGLATAVLPSASPAASSAKAIRRRRAELAWYLVTTVLAAGVGLVAVVWLNRV